MKRMCDLDANNKETILYNISYIRNYLIPKYRKSRDIDMLEVWKSILNSYLQRK